MVFHYGVSIKIRGFNVCIQITWFFEEPHGDEKWIENRRFYME